jgi:hypothetical protein
VLSASDEKIARLRTIADTRSGIEAACAQCKLSAMAGDQRESRRTLRDWRAKIGASQDPYEAAQLLANTAILIDEVHFAKRLIAEYLEPGFEVDISLDENPGRRMPSVKWYIQGSTHCFAFNPEVFRANNSELYIARWIYTLPLFGRLHSGQAGDGAVNLHLEDQGAIQGLSYCDNRPNVFLIPDPRFLRTHGYRETREIFEQRQIPWEERRPVAFWRGSTSGRPEPKDGGWRALPRVRLCEIGRKRPELIDAAITEIVQVNDDARDEIASSGLVAPRSPITDIQGYRYQIDIDGNSNSWPGMFQKLLSGSPILKVSSPYGYQQWYYPRLKPWVHFIPVKSDLSDLVEKVEWLHANDGQAREIGERARALAHSMDRDGELSRIVPTLVAAFRESRDVPEQSVCFGKGAKGNTYLGGGWEIADDSAWTTGRASSIEMPMPAGGGDYRIELELSACDGGPIPVTISVNGQIGRPHKIAGRETVTHGISIYDRGLDERLSIVLLNPAAHPASAIHPLEERLIAVKLHAIHIRKCATPVEYFPGPRDDAGVSHDRGSLHSAVMQALHREDVWLGFTPARPREASIQGWNGMYPPFKRFLAEAPNKIFIDVGVWKGQSTVFVAEFMRESGIDGCVVAVDTFLGSVEHFTNKRGLFQQIHGRPDLYETFLDNVFYRGLTHLVVPLPQTSTTAAAVLKQRGIRAGVVHIDASHEYEDTLKDAELYWPLIVSGGYLIGDDYHESWPGVVRAAQEFSRARGLELQIQPPKWILRKP